MEIGIKNRCVKLILPNGKVVDILTPVIEEMEKWVQDEAHKPESGGYIAQGQTSTARRRLQASRRQRLP